MDEAAVAELAPPDGAAAAFGAALDAFNAANEAAAVPLPPDGAAAAFDAALEAAPAAAPPPPPPHSAAAAFGEALDEATADTTFREATGVDPDALRRDEEAEATKAMEELSTLAAQEATSAQADTAFSREVDEGEVARAIEEMKAAVADSAAYNDQLRTMAAASTGFTLRKTGLQKARDWQVEFGPVWAPAGESTVITLSPQCDFRGEKIMATDTGAPRGYGTRIVSVMIGNRIQKLAPDRATTLTFFFAANSVANGIKWDTCPRSFQIQVTVSYVQSCTFDMTVFGKAVL